MPESHMSICNKILWILRISAKYTLNADMIRPRPKVNMEMIKIEMGRKNKAHEMGAPMTSIKIASGIIAKPRFANPVPIAAKAYTDLGM